PRPGGDRRSRGHAHNAGTPSCEYLGRDYRVPHLSRAGHREAVARQTSRTAARWIRCRARRRDGGHLWKPDGVGTRERSSIVVYMKQISRAAIIAVGSEMLTPTKIDTNSLFITEQLNLLGIQVAFKTIVGDDRGDLETAVRDALTRVDLLICCGGLGPTDDDLARPVVADVLRRPLVEDEAITERIRVRFQGRGLQMPEINRRQAMVPAGGIVVPNVNGTAPGLWIEHGAQLILLLPGPPRELKP